MSNHQLKGAHSGLPSLRTNQGDGGTVFDGKDAIVFEDDDGLVVHLLLNGSGLRSPVVELG